MHKSRLLEDSDISSALEDLWEGDIKYSYAGFFGEYSSF